MRGNWLVGLVAILINVAPAAQPKKLPSPLPADIVAAWEKAGGQSCWMGVEPLFSNASINFEGPKLADEVPGFQFKTKTWQPGVLNRLPPPGHDFGLCFTSTYFTNAGLKELSGLQHLRCTSPSRR